MYSPNIDNGKTIGKGGFGKCKVKFSSKYNKKIVEKQICPKSCFRASLIRNDLLLQILNNANKNEYENKHQALKKEAKMLKKLKFIRLKCCVEILDYKENPPTIIMEFCEGGDLRKLIDNYKKEIPLADRIEIISQVLEGLKTVHKIGIIHGDLKCANIFLANKYEKNRISSNIVKLGDFGLSDQDTILGGTPGFMAPEIRTTGGSFASDVYSIGKVMLEIITCLPSYVIYEINYNNLSNYSKFIPLFSGSSEFISLVKQCLNTNPSNRPTASQLNKNFLNNVLFKFNKIYEDTIKRKIEAKKRKYENVNNLYNNQQGFIKSHNHPLTFSTINWEKIGWVCDNCFEVFSINKSGFYCKVCKDYYICISCFQINKIDKEEFKNNNFRIRKKDENMGLFVIRENEELNQTNEKFSKKEINNNQKNRNSQRRESNNRRQNIPAKKVDTRNAQSIKREYSKKEIKIESNNCEKIKKYCCRGFFASIIIVFSLAILFGLYYIIITIISFIKTKK